MSIGACEESEKKIQNRAKAMDCFIQVYYSLRKIFTQKNTKVQRTRRGVYTSHINTISSVANFLMALSNFCVRHCCVTLGSVGRPRSRIGASFAVLECPVNKPVIVKFFEIGVQGKVKEVKI